MRGGTFWTGGIYAKQCNDSDLPFVWCPSMEYVSSKLTWRDGEPNIRTGDCVAIQIGGSKPGLFMSKCKSSYNGIGEYHADFAKRIGHRPLF
jgi:hypothetical protein